MKIKNYSSYADDQVRIFNLPNGADKSCRLV